MKNLNEFNNESQKTDNANDKAILDILNDSINEVNSSDREILLRAKDSVRVLQNYISEIRKLDKKSLTRIEKVQVKQTDIIVRAELKLLNIMISVKNMEFLEAFSPYQVLT